LSDLELYHYKLGMHLIGRGKAQTQHYILYNFIITGKVDAGKVSLTRAWTITVETGNTELAEHIQNVLDSIKDKKPY